VVDLAARVDGVWWLVDFKTSRPLVTGRDEVTPDAFYEKELQKYRPQLLAYREMWSRCREVEPAAVRPVLYWTALQRWDGVE
jgi:ATP-dependent exoDNAse (exonuclease V) beta subunit